ncbi:MAG: hypothetical protein GX995_01670 [Clostridiales bacterium]|nr:hypothetical protein [Clostridiales bacterium]
MLTIKRGDTFAFYANITDETGAALVTDTTNLKSQVRDTKYNLISELVIAPTETPGRYLFTSAETDSWPTTKLLMDIQINKGGQISSSQTVEISVIKDVTRDE